MASKEGGAKKGASSKGPDPQEILSGFQTLRSEQRALTTKLAEFEQECNEHKMVIETLKNVNEDRKCYRLIGGVLVERKVKEVLPALVSNQEKMHEVIQKLNEQISKKGQELNEYREKHNIRFRNIESANEEEDKDVESSNSSVLVA